MFYGGLWFGDPELSLGGGQNAQYLGIKVIYGCIQQYKLDTEAVLRFTGKVKMPSKQQIESPSRRSRQPRDKRKESGKVKKTGAEIVWESLERLGVTCVFGYPGGAILPTYDAMMKYKTHHVLVRHEQGATTIRSHTKPRPCLLYTSHKSDLWMHSAI